ncbi:Retrovirus-related Pol polyprotein from transposon 17.6 [Mytilus coruscus]|uniref:Retrovirus-related Pol polyprotein from transposon 17.6 n=1 Tax=Mytilus coruscus TaxID=42192 RepID=A0A6J8EME4_MYTCO|nr:Retrovirus-related Pol polyprotein from transposon 17.6 [Mytilus coruscus]
MQYILSGLQWEICVNYLDDIIVFSKSFEEHITRLQEVFDRIQLAGLKIAPKKCFIFQKKVSFLGHVVNAEGISPDPIKIEAVQSWPMPTNVKDVRSFLGTCSYYRKFIKDFSKIARPLHRLTEKNNLTWKKSSDKPKWPEISHLSQHHKTYWSQWDRLTVVDGILYRKWENTTTNDINLQYVLPSADRNRVLLLLHNDQLGGHLGFKRTIARIRHRFYWAGYASFVERWCKRCTECQKRNQPSHHTRGQMKTYIVGEPLERVSLDILGPVTQTYKGNKYVIVVTDYFTRYAEAYGVPDIEAQTVADN